MSARDLILVVATVLCVLAFAALVVVLLRVLDVLRALRNEVETIRTTTRPLLAAMQASNDEARSTMRQARDDLDRFDRVLGSAEAISGAVTEGGRVARATLSAPVIKAAGLASGTRRAVSRLRRPVESEARS